MDLFNDDVKSQPIYFQDSTYHKRLSEEIHKFKLKKCLIAKEAISHTYQNVGQYGAVGRASGS